MRKLLFALSLLVSVSAFCANPPLFGKVKVVSAFADYKVRVVTSFPDLMVMKVSSFQSKAGEWEFVDDFADFTIQFVDAFEDFTIMYVDAFPGIPSDSKFAFIPFSPPLLYAGLR